MKNKAGQMPNHMGMIIDFGNDRAYNQGVLLNALDYMCNTFQAFREITDTEIAEVLEMYARRKRMGAE